MPSILSPVHRPRTEYELYALRSDDTSAADAVLNYMNRNPDKRDLPAAALVVVGMDEAWCPQAPAAPSAQNKER